MNIEILNRPNRPYEVCYGDQIVGRIIKENWAGWRFHRYVTSWDYFNPESVRQLESMVDEKITVLNVTERLTS